MDIEDISVIGRSTQGVRLIRLGEDELVATVAKVVKKKKKKKNSTTIMLKRVKSLLKIMKTSDYLLLKEDEDKIRSLK